jgi:hypothetical protein
MSAEAIRIKALHDARLDQLMVDVDARYAFFAKRVVA